MTFKEFGENADIQVRIEIIVNDERAFFAEAYGIDGAIEQLGKAERAHVIQSRIEQQYEDLPEPIEDESRGFDV